MKAWLALLLVVSAFATQAEALDERDRPAFEAIVNTLAPSAKTLDWTALLQATATHPSLIGAPYQANPLDRDAKGTAEPLRAGFDGFDCVTYVETVLALARTIAVGKAAPADYAAELARLRYRNGEPGYCARQHYFGDWAELQVAARVLDEVTTSVAGDPANLAVLRLTHGFDFLSRNAAKTLALANSPERQACVAEQEAALSARDDGTPYIRATSLRAVSNQLRPGDLIAWVADVPGLDILHVGVVVARPNGRLELAQASKREGRVMVSPDLLRYAGSLRQQRGVRVFRPRDPR
ncbi:N-acetylmuramoyl-L-alanine amidase-like domain-containing protein [Nevskia sp.]|uniref:N-acetylmuramoyl-L-alanine amidase-like domain-containing protein n=1 Tax=Nevskia sp. TaxID=1929292 RepID=UPI0025DD03CF|nr:N-acetylmuramoyl-L-alanine amidase-like domain-containing protein [Nevskia sp.]